MLIIVFASITAVCSLITTTCFIVQIVRIIKEQIENNSKKVLSFFELNVIENQKIEVFEENVPPKINH